MYFITTKRMLEVCFSAHPNIQYRTSFYWLQIGYICQLATIWDCCSVDSLETETPKEITNMFDSIGKLTSKIQFE